MCVCVCTRARARVCVLEGGGGSGPGGGRLSVIILFFPKLNMIIMLYYQNYSLFLVDERSRETFDWSDKVCA